MSGRTKRGTGQPAVRGLLAEVDPAGRVIGLDQDPTMLDRARARLTGVPVTLVHANFDQLLGALNSVGVAEVDGLLADVGFASDQMDDADRGLSFQQDATGLGHRERAQ